MARQDALSENDRRLLAAIQHGLPLVPRPYADIGARLGWSEAEVMARLDALLHAGVIKRMGVIVRHHELGYRANAMVVWDVPDADVDALGEKMGRFPFVTLCYRRARRLPSWSYNLFSMIHARDRASALAQVDAIITQCDLRNVAHAVLFSRRRFKQRGAWYGLPASVDSAIADGRN